MCDSPYSAAHAVGYKVIVIQRNAHRITVKTDPRLAVTVAPHHRIEFLLDAHPHFPESFQISFGDCGYVAAGIKLEPQAGPKGNTPISPWVNSTLRSFCDDKAVNNP